ncbi:EGF-like domain protein [Dictyocaulus viviparus]|uniref:EGF-like domain protein n=1 Tax=Dictyocaulus viviparus TaxID=29172 RepID=A0A0D8XGL3_DICVI|nr:EGF-like domain protein [Dictyocaulus viviparus]
MINSYRCECESMYRGKYCEEKLQYCSKQLNPCQNGAKCERTENGYKCDCMPGFMDRNCSTNIDDCTNHKCQNNGICVVGRYSTSLNKVVKDGIESYSCKCVMGFSGEFCDIPPTFGATYPNTAQCYSSSCTHGSCYMNDQTKEYECRCHEGYGGKKCDELRSIGFTHPSAYVALEQWQVENGNLTFTIRTTNKLVFFNLVPH